MVKVDRRTRWHYTTTILRLRIGPRLTRYGIEIANFTISLALSAGTLMASAGTPYRLVPAHFYPCTQPFNGLWSGTTGVGRYQKKHSPTHTHPDRRTSFINFLHLLRPIASSLFSLRAWQSISTTSLQVRFRLPLGLGPSTSYFMHFFTQLSSFRSTCPYHRSLFCCNTSAMSSIPNLSLSSLLGNLSKKLKRKKKTN